jgi:hypothetical protein
MYFNQFPTINYTLDGGKTSYSITDFFNRVKSDHNNVYTSLAYEEYDIKEAETPEILAARIYGDSQLHWIILIVNEIIDPRFDWPLSSQALNNYIEDKYGINGGGFIHHYINDAGDIVHSSYAGAKYPVSNFEYENDVNETKRTIKILKPKYAPAFVKSFKAKIQS